ncbi:hypothetical protein [Actinomadura sp. 9N215]|uniref:hypothetical protein n=1 Tax=Actinomadura sp. 9N215 TaxID=3375150 RepID=UPI003795678E
MKNTHVSRAGRKAAMGSLAVVATAATLVGIAPSASATPTGCTATAIDSRNAESRCTGGTGEHRVIMRQRHFNPDVGEVDCVGPWVPVGSVSRVLCGVHQVVSVRVETR